MSNVDLIEKTFAPETRVLVTDKKLRLRRSPGIVTRLNAGRGSAYAMVLLDRADYDEPLPFDIDQLLVDDRRR